MIKLKDIILENEDYKMDHQAPGPNDGSPLYDLTLNETYPKDFYETMNQYKTGEIYDDNSLWKIWQCRNRPRIRVNIYRAVPKGVNTINQGDWVTITRSYAKDHGEREFPKGTWKILTKIVPAKDLWTNGDSIHEWGYYINPDPKVGERKIYSKEEMLKMGADGHLSRATLHKIPMSKIEGREPTPEPDDYKPGREITQPIEVEYDSGIDKYILYSGNHRVRQAEINGQKYILAFVQYK